MIRFNQPSLSCRTVWFSVFLIGIFIYNAPVLPYFIELSAVTVALAAILCAALMESKKIFYLARLALFCSIGFYAYIIKVYDDSLYFSVFEFSTQRLEVARKMFALTCIGAPFCWYGMLLAEKPASTGTAAEANVWTQPNTTIFNFLLLMAGFFIVLVASYFILSVSKGNIFQGAYGGSIEGTPIPLGGINIVAGIGLALCLYASYKLKSRICTALTVLLAGYFFVSCQLMRGLRQDMASTLFGLILIYIVLNKSQFVLKLKYFYLLIPIMAAFEIFGIVRSGISQWVSGNIPLSEVLRIGLGNGLYSDVVYSGTLGPIATTFSNAVEGIVILKQPIVWGVGYLQYIIRLVPEILYADRPSDFAYFFKNQFTSGGGIFELAEAIINFGALGAIIVPFIISYILSTVYNRFEQTKSLFYLLLLSSFMSVFLRGGWYQTFAYVKALEIGLIASIGFLISIATYNTLNRFVKKFI